MRCAVRDISHAYLFNQRVLSQAAVLSTVAKQSMTSMNRPNILFIMA